MKKRIISLLSAISLVIMLIPVTTHAYSVSVNGNPPGWGQNWWNLTPDEFMTVSLDDTVSYEGDRSLKIESWGNRVPDHYLMLGTTIYVKPERSYVYGGWVKAENVGNCYTMLNWVNQKNVANYDRTFDWRRFENTVDTTTETSLPFYILSDGDGGTVWFDSLYWYEVDDDGNPIGNNLFTYNNFDTGAAPKSENKVVAGEGTAQGFDESLDSLYNRISTADTFALSDMDSILGAMKVVGIERAENITIDAGTEDWSQYKTLKLPVTKEQYQVYDTNAQKNVTAEYKYAYDDYYFYMEVTVEDPIHYALTNTNYWQGDSLQVGISQDGESFGLEIGFSYDVATDTSFKTCSGLTTEQLNSIQFKAKREGIKTIYEIAYPWTIKFADGKPDNFLCTYLINNNDGTGRQYCVQVSKGISEGKFNSEFPKLVLTNDTGWYAWASALNDECNIGGILTFKFTIVNTSNEEREFELITGDDIQQIKIPARTGKNITYEHNVGEKYGYYTLNCVVKSGEEQEKFDFDYIVNPTKSYFDNTFKEYDEWLSTLESLLGSCKSLGIDTDYENIAFTILKEFYAYTEEDLKKNKYMQTAYNIDAMKTMYEEAKTNLNGYIAGTKTPLRVSRYQTSDVEINGKQLYADVKTGDTIENRPVYFSGYGHWMSPERIAQFSKELGVNATQVVISPQTVLMESNEGYGFKLNPDGLVKLKSQLDSAEANNVSIIIMLEHHAFPQWLINKYTDMAVSEAGGGFFIRYNLDHPVSKAAIETYVRAVTELAKDYKCVQSMAIGNEDMYRTQYIPYYKPYYQQYITEKYKGDINLLNEQYGTSYERFLDVEMPQKYTESPIFYDYREFNTRVFNGWHKWIADMIHEIIPDMKFHVKWVEDIYSQEWSRSREFFMINGMDPERFGEWAHINGNDGGYFFDYIPDSMTPLSYLMACDIQMGAKEAPIINTEVHLIGDKFNKFESKYQKLVNAYTWQFAVHGGAGQVHWFLDERSWEYELFSDRPDCMYQLGKTSLDLNRKAWQLAALNNKQGEVCMLYSQPSRLYTPSYTDTLCKAYEAIVNDGRKVDFVTESTINNISKYKVLILTDTNNVTEKVLNKINEFGENGGTIIMLGQNCLGRNEYDKAYDIELVNSIRNKSNIIDIVVNGVVHIYPVREELSTKINSILDTIDFGTRVELIDTKTGEKVKGVEYFNTEYNGKLLIDIADWDLNVDNAKKVKLRVNGADYTGEIKEHRSEEILPAEFTIEPFNPILLEIAK